MLPSEDTILNHVYGAEFVTAGLLAPNAAEPEPVVLLLICTLCRAVPSAITFAVLVVALVPALSIPIATPPVPLTVVPEPSAVPFAAVTWVL